jgi:hypothetical protein
LAISRAKQPKRPGHEVGSGFRNFAARKWCSRGSIPSPSIFTGVISGDRDLKPCGMYPSRFKRIARQSTYSGFWACAIPRSAGSCNCNIWKNFKSLKLRTCKGVRKRQPASGFYGRGEQCTNGFAGLRGVSSPGQLLVGKNYSATAQSLPRVFPWVGALVPISSPDNSERRWLYPSPPTLSVWPILKWRLETLLNACVCLYKLIRSLMLHPHRLSDSILTSLYRS